MLALAGFSAGGGFAAAAALIGLQPVIPAEQRFVANTLFIGAVTLAGYGIGPWLTGILSDSLGHHELAVSLAMVTAAAFAAARSEERRGGKECVSTCRDRGSPAH